MVKNNKKKQIVVRTDTYENSRKELQKLLDDGYVYVSSIALKANHSTSVFIEYILEK